MTMEVPDDVLTAIKDIVAWAHGCEGPDDVTFDDVIVHDVPVLEDWLTKLGLLPAPERSA